jgi:tyrosyl-tRNA synthetase
VLVEAGCFPSKGEARRMIKSGGLYLNNQRIDQEETRFGEAHCLTPTLAVVRKGKKNYHLLRFV